jgi:hypothetical protein
MNQINTENWKFFKVSEIFPYRKLKKISKKPEIEGELEFVSSTSLNNGVMSYVEEQSIPGKCITVSTNGQCFDAFYHENPIVISADVEVLYNKNLNKYNGIFIATVLRLEKPKWAYGRKPKKMGVFKTSIKLPALNDEPDWQYMTEYIQNRWIKTLNSKVMKTDIQLDLCNWKEFRIESIIKHIYKAKAYHRHYLNLSDKSIDSIQYVTRTETHNGFSGYVRLDDKYLFEKANAMIIGDTTATIFFQDVDFLCGDHIVVLRDKSLNIFTGLFIKTVLDKERYRYSYGRAFTIQKIKKTKIMLPALDNMNPDWEYMEKYIKSLVYSDKL